MKPLEFKIEEKYDSVNEEEFYAMVLFYEDGTTQEIYFYDKLPDGLELNKHYSIADIYGYKVVDDREGL
jgi:hypothetical protein